MVTTQYLGLLKTFMRIVSLNFASCTVNCHYDDITFQSGDIIIGANIFQLIRSKLKFPKVNHHIRRTQAQGLNFEVRTVFHVSI